MLHHFSDSFSCAINPSDVITAVPTAAALQSYKLTLSFHIWSTSLFPWFKQACTESSFQFRLKSFQVLIRDGNRDPQYVIICVPVALWQQAECYGFDSQGSHIRGLLQCLARQKRLILKAPSECLQYVWYLYLCLKILSDLSIFVFVVSLLVWPEGGMLLKVQRGFTRSHCGKMSGRFATYPSQTSLLVRSFKKQDIYPRMSCSRLPGGNGFYSKLWGWNILWTR